jgi:anti-anti-sigma factor
MPDAGFPVEVIRSVPVVAAPEDIDITNAAELRTALRQAAARGHRTFVVDMSRRQFCDTAGLHALVGAHKRPAPRAARYCWSSVAILSSASSRSPGLTA